MKSKERLGNSKTFLDVFQKTDVLVCLDFHSKVPETGGLGDRKLYSHGSGGRLEVPEGRTKGREGGAKSCGQ